MFGQGLLVAHRAAGADCAAATGARRDERQARASAALWKLCSGSRTVAAGGERRPQAVMLPRCKHRTPRAYDAARYAQCHPVEPLFGRLKQVRRVAPRYDKLDAHFLAFIHLPATGL